MIDIDGAIDVLVRMSKNRLDLRDEAIISAAMIIVGAIRELTRELSELRMNIEKRQ